MLRAFFRDLLAHKARVAMTLVAIALGAGAVVASWIVSDSVALGLATRDVRTDVGVVVRDSRLTPADRDRLAKLPGVIRATGVLAGRAGLIGPGGKLVESQTPLDQSGAAWDNTGRLRLTVGRVPAQAGEIALAKGKIGDRVRILLTDGKIARPMVVGLFGYRSLGDWDPAPTVAFDPLTAQRLFGYYARVELAVQPGADVRREVARAEPAATVSTGAELAAAAARKVDDNVQDLRLTLLPFAAVALLVGMFVIANTFTILVTARTRQFALLRAVGAKRGQVRRAVGAEAAVLGLVGGTLGALGGVALGPLMISFVRPGDSITVSVGPIGIVLGYVCAVVVTVLAAYGSARRAAAVPPVAALRTDANVPGDVRRRRTLIGVLVLVASVAMIALTSDPSSDTIPRLVALGAAAVLGLAVILLAPMLASVVLRPLTDLGGPATRHGIRNAARDPRRTAGTATAITIGVALVCAFATLSASFATLIASTTRNNIPVSTTVLQPATDGTTLAAADLAKVRGLPGVGTVAASRDVLASIRYAGGASQRKISAIDPAAFGTVLTPRITAGSADLRNGVVIAQNQAEMLGLSLGDRIVLVLDARTTLPTRIIGVYDATELSASIYFDSALAPSSMEISAIYATGPHPAAARHTIDAAYRDRPDVTVTDRDGLIAQGIERQRVGFLVMNAMFGLAILIAGFGVVNTLALSAMERTREIGLVRAVGATRVLVRRAIRMESLVISLFGGVLGVLLGLTVGAVMQHAMLGQSLWSLTVPYNTVGVVLVAAVATAALAAVWPARLATRTPVLTAING